MIQKILFAASAVALASAAQPNITDYEQKGLAALFELANLTTHVPESFILNKRRADDVIKQISIFERQGVDSLTAGGFVAAFLDLIEGDDTVVELLKAVDMRMAMLRTSSTNYTTVLPQWLGINDPTLECLNKYETTIQRVSSAIHKLYVYVQAKNDGEEPFLVKAALDAFKTECQNNKCADTTNILLSGLNGGTEVIFRCDLQDILYQGLPGQFLQLTQQIEKGYRDMVSPYNGYLLSFLGTSLVVQSAYESLQSVDVNQWQLL